MNMAKFNDFMTRLNLDALRDYCALHGNVVRYAKGESLVREGELCRNVGFVKSGYFKYTAISTDGDECVVGFSFAGEPVMDYVRSFLHGKSSLISIIAGCDAEMIQVPLAIARPLMIKANPGFIAETSSVLLLEAYMRYLTMHTMTPLERYKELLPRLRDVIDLVPYRELASFLAVSRRQFQRIREEVEK